METVFVTHKHAPPTSPVIPFVRREAQTRAAVTADRLQVALIATYVPRKCGIATFTADIVEQLGQHGRGVGCKVHALDGGRGEAYPPGVMPILADDEASYAVAARRINESGADVVWLQHEFGIFGGADGELVSELVNHIAAPLVITFHTVLAEPSERQRKIVEHLISRASRIMVMSRHGRDLLVSLYRAPADRIVVIPHGAPDRPFGRTAQYKRALGLENRNVLMTFGLLGPGKGLEHAIGALPAIIAAHPDTVYRIVGATHPNELAANGESYRRKLEALAEELGVASHIEWDNRFVDTADLLDQLEACDIYLTPYPNLQQATSGTLSYAVALGKAVVSTPYVHARELLAGKVGWLVEPNSSASIASAVTALLDDPDMLSATQRRAYGEGRKTIWKRFAEASCELVRTANAQVAKEAPLTATPGVSGLIAMCDSTGIYQHAIGIVPDRRHGYCLDDNVRALMLMNHISAMTPTDRLGLSSTFASFVQHAWNPQAGRFRNFMRFERTWSEEIGSDDSNGRALRALGDTAAHSPFPDLRDWALGWFDLVLPALGKLESPRALAFVMLGAAEVLRVHPDHQASRAVLEHGATFLARLLAESRRPDWAWFEAVLAYDNPRLCQALIAAGDALGDEDMVTLGLSTLRWIAARQTAGNGLFHPIGSEGMGRQYGQMPFDQQPLEAQAAIEACLAAYRISPEPCWRDHALAAYRWFFGANARGAVLADLASGRCRDGVTPRGANLNCGAESILAFQLSHIAMQRLLAKRIPAPDAGDSLADQHEGRAKTLAYS